MKRCGTCRRKLPLTMFTKDKTRRDGYCIRCRRCNKESCSKYWHEKGRFKRYGITKDQYLRLAMEQGYCCAICNEPDTNLHIDHTYKVRGLLCGRCNRALGLFEDNVSIMWAAISYVQRFGG